MGHVTRETPWCTIDLNTTTGQILLQQRWQYHWMPEGFGPWILAEKRNFHSRSDRIIWAVWSNRARLTVSGSSDVARRLAGRSAPVNLDVRWTLANPHWNVFVHKVAAGVQYPSEVFWNVRRINLGSRDFAPVNFGTAVHPRRQPTVAHEFGHAAGNTSVLSRGDEYRLTSPHHADQRSIMHTGAQLRARHFRTIIEEMNQMIPGTIFALPTL